MTVPSLVRFLRFRLMIALPGAWPGLNNGKARTNNRRAIRFAPDPATHPTRKLKLTLSKRSLCVRQTEKSVRSEMSS